MSGLPEPGESFGRYEILRRLGRGAMGVVFAARQIDLGREVALKVLSADLADSAEYRNRFTREAAALGRIDSPHVIHVYEAGEHGGWLFIATQLVDGGDLQQWMNQHGPLTPYAATDLVTQVAIGMRDAHRLGILHRDIKPSNVLLKQTDDGLWAYLCDLGISQLLDAEHTRTTGVIGTLGYMAPERHEGQDASVASDVYALGCLLWAAMTGAAPYVGTDMSVALSHVREPIRQLDDEVDGAASLNQVLARSMAKNPSDRYPDAAEMIGALRAAQTAIGAAVAEATVVRAPALHATAPQTVVEPVDPAGAAPETRAVPRRAAVPTEAASPAGPRRRRTLALVVVAAVLVAGGVGWAALGQGDDPGSPTKASSNSTTTPTSGPEGTGTPAPSVTCWNGATAVRASACSFPRGEDGAKRLFAPYRRARAAGACSGWKGGAAALDTCTTSVAGDQSTFYLTNDDVTEPYITSNRMSALANFAWGGSLAIGIGYFEATCLTYPTATISLCYETNGDEALGRKLAKATPYEKNLRLLAG